MYTVEQALAQILAATPVLSVERMGLGECLGRVLSEDIYADTPLPPFTNSAVDGYAARAEDTQRDTHAESQAAGSAAPVLLTCVEEIAAGVWPQKTIRAGQCARIMTGAPVPEGADAIVMVEDTHSVTGNRIAIREAAQPGQHIRHTGEDVQKGERVLKAGDLLHAAQIGLLATVGRSLVPVVRSPRVAVISTGDEVVEVLEGVVPAQGKIRNSNSHALAALVREAGATLHSRLHIPDDFDATLTALRRCVEPISEGDTGADVIVTAGGVSVGERDFVKPALEALGSLDLWRVAMKPGKPLAFGRIGSTLFFGLPGNPVSAQVTFELFVRPALWKMAGRREENLTRREVEAELMESVRHIPGRREYLRGVTTWEQGRFVARPLTGQSSANLQALALANSLLILPAETAHAEAGTQIAVILLD